MTSVQGRNCLHRECPSVVLSNFFLLLELDDKLSDQPTRPLEPHFPITIVFVAAPSVSKYTKENLQQIFKTILEVQIPIIFIKY